GDVLENLGIGDVAGQPVTADQEHIARPQTAAFKLKLGKIADPDRTRDDVTARKRARLLGRDGAVVHQLLHLRVVARDLLQLAAAHAVDAAVARPDARIVPVEYQQDRHRGADQRAAALVG